MENDVLTGKAKPPLVLTNNIKPGERASIFLVLVLVSFVAIIKLFLVKFVNSIKSFRKAC